MGVTYAGGSIAGNAGIREYDFLVDTGSTWMTLPPDAIAELELDAISGQVAEITTPTDVLYLPLYRASGTLEGIPFDTHVVPAYRPMVGYELLQRLGFVVDLVRERIVLRTEWEANPPPV